MALLWLDGFDKYGTLDASISPSDILQRKYSVVNTTSYTNKSGRVDGQSLYMSSTSCYLVTPALTTDATITAGLGVKFAAFPSSFSSFLAFYDGATQGINLRINEPGELAIYRGSTLVSQTSGLGLLVDTWYFIELKVTCADSGGLIDVQVGGTRVNDLYNASADTKEGTHDYHDTIRVKAPSQYIYVDDLYILDSSGGNNTTFVGNCRIQTVIPESDYAAGWDYPSPGTHYTEVDESPCDDDSTYIQEDTTGNRDLFEYVNAVAVGTIYGIQICTDCRETDATTYDLKMPIRSGGTIFSGDSQAIGTTSYVTKRRIAEVDPNTNAAWGLTDLNSSQFGVEIG
jgi:hypothetical protein